MPSVRVGFISGGTNILSGNYFSGLGAVHPVGGIQLRAAKSNSGSIYFSLSGGVTVNSVPFRRLGCSCPVVMVPWMEWSWGLETLISYPSWRSLLVELRMCMLLPMLVVPVTLGFTGKYSNLVAR